MARLFEREARDLLPFAFSSSDGRYTGEALSARPIVFTAPKGPDEVPTFSGLLEGDETFECSLHAGKIAPGERIHNTVAALEKGAQVEAKADVYSPVHPLELQRVAYRPSPETPGLLARVAESEQGPRIEANIKLDEHGALERDSSSALPNGPALILTRIWTSGIPR